MAGKMTETHKGLLTSLVVHMSIVPLLFGLFAGLHDKTAHVMTVDFTLSSNGADPANGSAGPRGGEQEKVRTTPLPKSVKTSRQTNHTRHKLTRQAATVSAVPEQPASDLPVQAAIVSDPQSSNIIHGQRATSDSTDVGGHAHGKSEDMSSGPSSAGGTGGRQIGNRQGSGSNNSSLLSSSKDYTYIRDAVMKNIRYPERARRMGFEGKTVLSFIVLENGATSDIKVHKSSGYRLLDESAKEAVAETHITKKVPYRVVVHLPITYTLQASKDDRT
ncbi:MAG: hypothetical protein C0399_05400 [Syntrophus sp. (in: bacteria)]|nr:hypothetical protein [Syntrophus sp. (in: bacteria)]